MAVLVLETHRVRQPSKQGFGAVIRSCLGRAHGAYSWTARKPQENRQNNKFKVNRGDPKPMRSSRGQQLWSNFLQSRQEQARLIKLESWGMTTTRALFSLSLGRLDKPSLTRQKSLQLGRWKRRGLQKQWAAEQLLWYQEPVSEFACHLNRTFLEGWYLEYFI